MSSVNKSFPDPNHFVINDIVSDNIKNLDSTAREGKPPLDLLCSPVKASIHKPTWTIIDCRGRGLVTEIWSLPLQISRTGQIDK